MAERLGGERQGGREDVLNVYLSDISHRSLLTREDEQRLARAIVEGRAASRELEEEGERLPPDRRRFLGELVARCEQSMRQFIEANLRLVVSIAKRYRHPRLPLSDLIQEGNLGLLQAVHRFDHTRGFRFSTYATFWIRKSISRAIANSGRLIRLPVDAGESVARIRRTRAEMEAEQGRTPSADELAGRLGMTPGRVAELLGASAEPVSVDEGTGADADGPALGEALADPAAEASLEKALGAMVPRQVERLLGRLDDRERRILCLRFGFDGHAPRSRAAVGACLGLTGERIRQVEARALSRLRRMPEAGEARQALGS